MLRFHMSSHVVCSGEILPTHITGKLALVMRRFRSFSFRHPSVKLFLVLIHIALKSECFVAEFAGKSAIFVRLYPAVSSSTSHGVVTLVVRVQLFDAVVVTVADLTHEVSVCCLKQKRNT